MIADESCVSHSSDCMSDRKRIHHSTVEQPPAEHTVKHVDVHANWPVDGAAKHDADTPRQLHARAPVDQERLPAHRRPRDDRGEAAAAGRHRR